VLITAIILAVVVVESPEHAIVSRDELSPFAQVERLARDEGLRRLGIGVTIRKVVLQRDYVEEDSIKNDTRLGTAAIAFAAS
jgi:hypothetical protein